MGRLLMLLALACSLPSEPAILLPLPGAAGLLWQRSCGEPSGDASARAAQALIEHRHDCDPAEAPFTGTVEVAPLATAFGHYLGPDRIVVACNQESQWYDNIPWEARNHCCAVTTTCEPY